MNSINELKGKQIHFVGIGGAGMSGIARIMLSAGLKISGSDVKESPITQSLTTLGAKIFIGHRAENIEDIDLMIISNAISSKNPEIESAQKRSIEILSRAQALA